MILEYWTWHQKLLPPEFKEKPQKNQFYPATYITMTGKSDEHEDELPEVKKKILDTVFNNINNK